MQNSGQWKLDYSDRKQTCDCLRMDRSGSNEGKGVGANIIMGHLGG